MAELGPYIPEGYSTPAGPKRGGRPKRTGAKPARRTLYLDTDLDARLESLAAAASQPSVNAFVVAAIKKYAARLS